LYLEKLGGWSLFPVAAGKQRKLLLPMNVIVKDIQEKELCGFLPLWVSM
jgi:hypothetical protein